MPRLEFTAMPKGMGPRGAWVFLDLPRESVETFGTKARVAVRLTVGGKAFRVSVFPDGQGGHQLNFNKAMQAATGWSEGKAVKVVVEADPKPRIVVVPKDLKAALQEAMDFRGPALVNIRISQGSARKAQEFRWHS